jgi:hypothetical protein
VIECGSIILQSNRAVLESFLNCGEGHTQLWTKLAPSTINWGDSNSNNRLKLCYSPPKRQTPKQVAAPLQNPDTSVASPGNTPPTIVPSPSYSDVVAGRSSIGEYTTAEGVAEQPRTRPEHDRRIPNWYRNVVTHCLLYSSQKVLFVWTQKLVRECLRVVKNPAHAWLLGSQISTTTSSSNMKQISGEEHHHSRVLCKYELNLMFFVGATTIYILGC